MSGEQNGRQSAHNDPLARRGLPVQPSERPQRRPFWPVLLALVAGLALFAVLFFITLGYVGPLVVIAAGVFLLSGLHWLVWGRWLTRSLRAEIEAATARDAAEERARRRAAALDDD